MRKLFPLTAIFSDTVFDAKGMIEIEVPFVHVAKGRTLVIKNAHRTTFILKTIGNFNNRGNVVLMRVGDRMGDMQKVDLVEVYPGYLKSRQR